MSDPSARRRLLAVRRRAMPFADRNLPPVEAVLRILENFHIRQVLSVARLALGQGGKMSYPIAPIASAAAAAAMLASPAAGEVAAIPRVRVELSDLDLRSDVDVARLQRRIKSAARVACGRPSPSTLRLNPRILQCQLDAFNSASGQAETIVAAVRAGKDQRLAVSDSLRTAAR